MAEFWSVEDMEGEAKDRVRGAFGAPLKFRRTPYAQMYDIRYCAKKNIPVLDGYGNEYALSGSFFVNQGFTKSYR